MKAKRALDAIRGRFKELGIDALLLSSPANIRYASGFTGSSGFALITRRAAWLLTDPRYTEQSKAEVKGSGFRVSIYKKRGLDALAAMLSAAGRGVVGFEGGVLPYDSYARLKGLVKRARFKSVPAACSEPRMVKGARELDLIRAAAAVLDTGYKAAMRLVKPGVVERDAAAAIEAVFRKNGGDGTAFDTVIASGWRGALPHGKASMKKVGASEFVVVDMGVLKDGYNSDCTRTFFTGRRPTKRHVEVYNAVLEAQLAALATVRAGVEAGEVDEAARAVIRKRGFGRYFTHSTGHGVGLEIHEAPSISPGGRIRLEEGMVITIEPGIYIPGWGGVRIEDMAAVERDGCEIITKTTKELVLL